MYHSPDYNQSFAHHSTILYFELMKFSIQEELLLRFLDTKFHYLSVQNGEELKVII